MIVFRYIFCLWTFCLFITLHNEGVCSSLEGPFCTLVNQKSLPDWGRALYA